MEQSYGEHEYVYTQLDPDCIRVLELLPGRADEEIRIRLRTVDLLALRTYQYEALSYTWGSTENSKRLWTESPASNALPTREAFIFITQNLHEALLHLRYLIKTRVLWIDAVCINQKDLEERSIQVPLMSSIYRDSKRTILWLGPAADDSDRALELFRTWTEFVAWDDGNFRTKAKKDIPEEYSWLTRAGWGEDIDPKDFRACQKLLERPWFQRLWVRQEVFLSEKCAHVVCGRETISWNCFRAGFYTFDLMVKSASYLPSSKMIGDLILARTSDLRDLLVMLRRTDCSDPRDRIYGILGIIENNADRFSDLLKPDYQISVQDLYVSACKVLVEDDRDLSLLHYSCLGGEDSDLPSWVPDWRRTPTTYSDINIQYADLLMDYTELDVEGSVLLVKGVCVGHVEKVEPFKLVEATYEDTYENMQRIINSFTKAETQTDSRATTKDLIRIIQNDRTFTDFNFDADGAETTITLDQATDLMLDYLSRPFNESLAYIEDGGTLEDQFYHCWSQLRNNCTNRAAVLTDRGHLALVPQTTEPGDTLVVLLGSNLPIVLRPQDSGCHKLVGPAFAPAFVHGEALVGELAPPWNFVKYRTNTSIVEPKFRNQSTGEITALDPRVDWSQLQVEKGDPRGDWRLTRDFGRPLRRPDQAYLLKNHPDREILTFNLI